MSAAKQTTQGGSATLRVRQIKSGIGFTLRQKATLSALGLGRIGRVRVHEDNAAIRGMLKKIGHLVVVESLSAAENQRNES